MTEKMKEAARKRKQINPKIQLDRNKKHLQPLIPLQRTEMGRATVAKLVRSQITVVQVERVQLLMLKNIWTELVREPEIARIILDRAEATTAVMAIMLTLPKRKRLAKKYPTLKRKRAMAAKIGRASCRERV